MNKKCLNCMTVQPDTHDICEKCNSTKFELILEEPLLKVEASKEEKENFKEQINSDVKSGLEAEASQNKEGGLNE